MIIVTTVSTPPPVSTPYDTETDFVGGVPADLTEFDLNQSSYGGLANGDTARWRVQVLNDHGEWSEWSDWATFTRVDKGTVTITTPTTTVIEFTPPTAWTTTFAQAAWRLMIFDDSLDEDTPIHDTGRKKGDTQEYTIPSKDDASGERILRDGRDYRLVVRAWDGVDRVATSGDPSFVQDVVVFSYDDDPTPNPVTSLAATQVTDTPYVDVTWQSSYTPDAWVVIVDGQRADDPLTGTDLLVSGTSYKYRYKDAAPGPHTYEVKPLVNGATGHSPAAVTLTSVPTGIWILGPDDVDVSIVVYVNDDAASFAMPDRATTFELSSGGPVRISQGVNGLRADQFRGAVLARVGRTTDEWADRLLKLKKREDVVTLYLGADTIRARLFDIVVDPSRDGGQTRAVSFGFFQTGTPDWLS